MSAMGKSGLPNGNGGSAPMSCGRSEGATVVTKDGWIFGWRNQTKTQLHPHDMKLINSRTGNIYEVNELKNETKKNQPLNLLS